MQVIQKNFKPRDVLLAAVFVAVHSLSALAQAPPAPLTVGFTSCYRPRLPLDTFTAQHPEIPLKESPYTRNPWDAARSLRLPYAFDALPEVFAVIVGRRSEDIPQLADRGLIEPVEPILAEMGISPDEFLSNAREAVTYNGHMFAIPHHVQTEGLFVHRDRMAAFGLAREYGSWEELLAAAEEIQSRGATTKDGAPLLGLSAFDTPFAFAELLTVLTGEAPVDYGRAESWASERMSIALDLIQSARQRGVLGFRTMNKPLRVEETAIFGVDHIESLDANSAYVLIPFPPRLHRDDPPAERPRQFGMLEAWAVRANSPDTREKVLAYLRWLLRPETEWTVFEATNQMLPDAQWHLDSVHVPLRPALLESVDFDYAARKFPEFLLAASLVQITHFPAYPQETEHAALAAAEAAVLRQLGSAPAATWLPAMQQEVLKAVQDQPVASATYALY